MDALQLVLISIHTREPMEDLRMITDTLEILETLKLVKMELAGMIMKITLFL
jgi:hypothetical protein